MGDEGQKNKFIMKTDRQPFSLIIKLSYNYYSSNSC